MEASMGTIVCKVELQSEVLSESRKVDKAAYMNTVE